MHQEQPRNARQLLIHPFFLVSLLVLLLNDFSLKENFSNALTGKLSDFAGLVVFPVFLAILFPRFKKFAALITAVLFIIWETPVVTPLIEWINTQLPLRMYRVIDYSDYWALSVLPLTHRIIVRPRHLILSHHASIRILQICIFSITIFAISATSLLAPGTPEGTVYIGKSYTIKKSKEEVLASIRSLGYEVQYHENTINIGTSQQLSPWYQTNNIIIDHPAPARPDTILNVKYYLDEFKPNRTRLTVINVTLTEEGHIQQWQVLRRLSKEYTRKIRDELIRKIR